MSFSKGIKFDVKPFKFGQLAPEAGEEKSEAVSAFELKSLKDASAFKNNISEEVIRKERGFEKEKSFSILPLVREHRGLRDQEAKDHEDSIEREVRRRVSDAIAAAKEEGYQAGHQEGYNKAYQEALGKLDGKIEDFVDILNNLKEQCHNVLSENKQDAYKMIKSLTQWITLKETQDESYLERLLEKLIHEMNTKSNLVVRVSQNSFKYMPEIIERIEAKMGALTNVRVEMDLDQDAPGIILESENGIIDGSTKAQMASLEKLFESVGLSVDNSKNDLQSESNRGDE